MESAPGIFLVFVFSFHMAMIIECLVAFFCYQHWEYKLIDRLSQCFFQILPIAMYIFCLCIFSTDLQQRTEDRENTNHTFRPFHITGESCYCWTHSKQSDYHFTNPKKKLTTEIFFFSLGLKQCLNSPRKALGVKAKMVMFLQCSIKMIKEEIQCYLPEISVVSIPIPAFQSHREQSLNLYYCSLWLIPETDVVVLFIYCNCFLIALTPDRWDCPTGNFSQVRSNVMPSVQESRSCHRRKSLPKINSVHIFLFVRCESSY